MERGFPRFSMLMEQMEMICKGIILKNTKKTTNWAVKVFEQWEVKRNEAASSDDKLCPSNLVECPVPSDLNYWLLHFMVKAHHSDVQPCPASSILKLCPVCVITARSTKFISPIS